MEIDLTVTTDPPSLTEQIRKIFQISPYKDLENDLRLVQNIINHFQLDEENFFDRLKLRSARKRLGTNIYSIYSLNYDDGIAIEEELEPVKEINKYYEYRIPTTYSFYNYIQLHNVPLTKIDSVEIEGEFSNVIKRASEKIYFSNFAHTSAKQILRNPCVRVHISDDLYRNYLVVTISASIINNTMVGLYNGILKTNEDIIVI